MYIILLLLLPTLDWVDFCSVAPPVREDSMWPAFNDSQGGSAYFVVGWKCSSFVHLDARLSWHRSSVMRTSKPYLMLYTMPLISRRRQTLWRTSHLSPNRDIFLSSCYSTSAVAATLSSRTHRTSNSVRLLLFHWPLLTCDLQGSVSWKISVAKLINESKTSAPSLSNSERLSWIMLPLLLRSPSSKFWMMWEYCQPILAGFLLGLTGWPPNWSGCRAKSQILVCSPDRLEIIELTAGTQTLMKKSEKSPIRKAGAPTSRETIFRERAPTSWTTSLSGWTIPILSADSFSSGRRVPESRL